MAKATKYIAVVTQQSPLEPPRPPRAYMAEAVEPAMPPIPPGYEIVPRDRKVYPIVISIPDPKGDIMMGNGSSLPRQEHPDVWVTNNVLSEHPDCYVSVYRRETVFAPATHRIIMPNTEPR